MRVAVLSDLHANLHALEAVAKEVEREDVDEIWCLGDIVGYGAHPREVLAWVHENADVTVKGNHDHAVATGDASGFNPVASAAARYHAQLLTPPERARLHDLPERVRRNSTVDALLVHASPEDPLREYVLPEVARQRLVPWSAKATLLFLGHTHVPFIARLHAGGTRPMADDGFASEIDEEPADPILAPPSAKGAAARGGVAPRTITVVNPGSVGQPRDGDPRASWALLDLAARRVTLHRVAYDVDGAANAIRQAKLDPFLASRLYRGA